MSDWPGTLLVAHPRQEGAGSLPSHEVGRKQATDTVWTSEGTGASSNPQSGDRIKAGAQFARGVGVAAAPD